MASSLISKSGRRKTKDGDVDEEDKISELPDAILCHILSFFPTTEDAIRTSFLSRRWRYVWTSVPCILLDDWDWIDTPKSPMPKDCFPKFVDKVLHLSDLSGLRKFSLYCHKTYDLSRVNEWISNVIMRRGIGIEELYLHLEMRVELPLCIFTSKRLAVLKLVCHGTLLNVPVSACLPSLKTIHLRGLRLCSDDSLKNLLDGCPVLEMLYFACEVDDHPTTFVRSYSLKYLNLWIPYHEIALGVVVDAPNLEKLDIKGKVTETFDVKDLSSLVQVRLSLDCKRRSEIYGNRLFELLGKMSNTKYMTIYEGTMNALEHATLDTFPIFHNLTDLYVDSYSPISGQVLPFLLECSPNLINLDYGTSYKLQCREPKCLMLYLEKIRFDHFKGYPGEMKMVNYFLKNAPVLKKMSIMSVFSSLKENLEIHEKVSELRRISTACLVKFRVLYFPECVT